VKRFLGRTSAEERRRILDALFGEGGRRRWHRFAILMALSIVVAAMGLSLDSAAVVIGAMLLAPLMTPIMAFSAALCMGWPRRMAASGAAVLLASGGSVGLAWLLAKAQPSLELTGEILSRTAPDGRDLAVALAAGAAGAYATAREDISGALPGVAVAVALVPPVTTIGIALELGRYDLAEGAGLLYTANLVAIVLVSTMVLLATGFVPLSRLSQVTPRVLLGVFVALAAAVAIALPLAQRSLTYADRQKTLRDVEAAVVEWLGNDTTLELQNLELKGNRVTVDLAGPEAPPSAQQLAVALAGELGESVEIRTRWSQRSVGIERITDQTGLAAVLDVAPLRPIVERWLLEGGSGGRSDRLVSLDVDDGGITLLVVGPVAPPSAATLAAALEEELGQPIEVTVHWTEQRVYASDVPPDATAAIRDAAKRWAAPVAGLLVTAVEIGENEVIIDLAGEHEPSDVAELAEIAERELGRAVAVRVRFTERRMILDAPPAS
jgi:uncharacterized hydrophobic protein (TIGR00271 family)